MVAMRVARDLVPGISHAYTEVDLERRRSTGVMEPLDSVPSPDLIEVMDTYVFQHPVISAFAESHGTGAQMISDFLSPHDYQRLEIYGDFYRFLDTEDQLAIQLSTSSNRVVGLVANRDRRGFSERDRTLFDLIRPHLIQSYQTAQILTMFEELADAGDQQAVWLTPAGRVAHATRGAQALFDTYWGPRRVAGAGLPEPLIEWLKYQRSRDWADAVRTLQPLQVYGLEGRLTIRLVIGSMSGTYLLLLNEYRSMLPNNAFAALGLSPRQTEVVRWVVEGKSSAEIGELLGVKSRTVEKHLEHIFERLDVTSRAGLVARALQSLGER
jgi:DNA-binding CsgD family transcriptional regulator